MQNNLDHEPQLISTVLISLIKISLTVLIKLNLLTSRTIISVVGRGLKLWCGVVDIRPKGQLISECLFDVLNFAKNQRKN